MIGQWKPGWSETQIMQIPQKVGEGLKNGIYSGLIKNAQMQCKGKSWWDRQFDITARAACSSLKEIDDKISLYKEDSVRVIRMVRDQWLKYCNLVIGAHGHETLKEIISSAKSSPSDLYLYLVTVHIQKPWLTHKPGHEASLQSAWSKIGQDNQFLWPMKTFEKVFI